MRGSTSSSTEMAHASDPNLEIPDENNRSLQRCGKCRRPKNGHPQPYGRERCELDPVEEDDENETDQSANKKRKLDEETSKSNRDDEKRKQKELEDKYKKMLEKTIEKIQVPVITEDKTMKTETDQEIEVEVEQIRAEEIKEEATGQTDKEVEAVLTKV